MSAEAPDNPPAILLSHYLNTLKLPTFQREHQKPAWLCASEGVNHVGYLARLAEREMIERDRRKVERRIKAAKFTHHVNFLEMNGESCRLAQSRARKAGRNPHEIADAASGLLLRRPTAWFAQPLKDLSLPLH